MKQKKQKEKHPIAVELMWYINNFSETKTGSSVTGVSNLVRVKEYAFTFSFETKSSTTDYTGLMNWSVFKELITHASDWLEGKFSAVTASLFRKDCTPLKYMELSLQRKMCLHFLFTTSFKHSRYPLVCVKMS